jgi:hypothetical protein
MISRMNNTTINTKLLLLLPPYSDIFFHHLYFEILILYTYIFLRQVLIGQTFLFEKFNDFLRSFLKEKKHLHYMRSLLRRSLFRLARLKKPFLKERNYFINLFLILLIKGATSLIIGLYCLDVVTMESYVSISNPISILLMKFSNVF